MYTEDWCAHTQQTPTNNGGVYLVERLKHELHKAALGASLWGLPHELASVLMEPQVTPQPAGQLSGNKRAGIRKSNDCIVIKYMLMDNRCCDQLA